MKHREFITSEAKDYFSMNLAEFMRTIKDEMCPSDATELAAQAPKLIKKVKCKTGCSQCPMIEYVIKLSNITAELCLWLEAEWNKDKMFDR